MSAWAYSVCHYKGSIYVGLENNTVTKIDSDYTVSNSFITCSGAVVSVFVYEGKIYTLVGNEHGGPFKICVYDMSGKLVTQWNHSKCDQYNNMLAVVAGQIVIPDATSNTIVVCSLNGELLKSISCPNQINDSEIVCCSQDNYLFVSSFSSNKISKIDMTTGELMWSHTDVQQPLGITCYSDQYLLVAGHVNKTIRILDINTGKFMI